jgi:hypothetical protein
VLGGGGFAVQHGARVRVIFTLDDIRISTTPGTEEQISYAEVCELTISGPGTVTSGGGFIGGGFGVEGAIEGIAVAGLLNALTTRSKIQTFISLVCVSGELHLHFGSLEPGALRIAMAGVFVALRRWDPAWRQAALNRLDLARGDIGDARYEQLKKRIVEAEDAADEDGSPSKCLNCAAVLPWLAKSCPRCKTPVGGAGLAGRVL